MGKIIIPYKPRDIFLPYHEDTKRFSLTVAHRRAGKTVARVNKLIRKAVECEKLDPRFAYIAPFYVQAKDIAWLYLKRYCAPLLELGGKVNESELSVTLPHNNAVIRLYGAENAERMRGLYQDGIVMDEAQGIASTVLTQVILPSLADRIGWLDASGTPRGYENLLGELYMLAKDNPDDWFLQVLKASETDVLPEEELARQRQLMSEDEYAQEFECSFEAAIPGGVYSKYMARLDEQGQISDAVTYDPNYPVYTAWDLGFDDSTAIVFYQVGVGEIFIIDYYEHNGEGIGHYCDVLKEKPYQYHTHFVPHDALNKVMAAGGRSIVEQAMKDHGVKMQCIPATSQQNGIEALRMTLPRCWFNKTTSRKLVAALMNYCFEYDDDRKVFKSKPLHNWASHGCDAVELMAVMWRSKAVTVQEMKEKAVETEFFRKRAKFNMDKADPYRLKPIGKRK